MSDRNCVWRPLQNAIAEPNERQKLAALPFDDLEGTEPETAIPAAERTHEEPADHPY